MVLAGNKTERLSLLNHTTEKTHHHHSSSLPLAESVLIPLQLTAAASATDTAIHKKVFRSGNTALIISNEEINNIMKTVNCLEESGLLIKGVSKTIKNEAKEQKQAFLSMLLGTLGTSLLGNLKADK